MAYAFSSTQPQAAYAALTHGIMSKWLYVARTIPNISDLFLPLEEAIRHRFLPALTGRSGITDEERDLFALPCRLGGLGIPNPTKVVGKQYISSQRVSAPLTALILQQERTYPEGVTMEQAEIRSKVKAQGHQEQRKEAERLRERLPQDMQRTMDFCSEKGASSWLGVIPMEEHGFRLHKGAFRDALCLRYAWKLPHTPSHCACGSNFTVEHAFSCSCGGFPTLRHNDIRDITASMLTEVCHNVRVEPELQPLSGEQMKYKTANVEEGARLDVRANGFWGSLHQSAFFDVRVFNPYALSNRKSSPAATYRKHENEKRRAYEERIREVEHGSFTPLVFSAVGGMGAAASTFYQRLASTLSEKRGQPYSKTIGWLRCTLTFSLLRSELRCVRGARSTWQRPERPPAMEVAY